VFKFRVFVASLMLVAAAAAPRADSGSFAITNARIVPVSWVCGNAEPPNKMIAKGLNKTDVPVRFLPLNCRAASAASAPP